MSEWYLLAAYLAGAAVTIACCGYDRVDVLPSLWFGSLWPFFAAMAVVIAPFFGIYLLGKKARGFKITKEDA